VGDCNSGHRSSRRMEEVEEGATSNPMWGSRLTPGVVFGGLWGRVTVRYGTKIATIIIVHLNLRAQIGLKRILLEDISVEPCQVNKCGRKRSLLITLGVIFLEDR